MTAQRAIEPYFSDAEYREVEERTGVRHEYINDQIYAMAGGSPNHNRLSAAAVTSLSNQLRGKPCEPFGSDQKIHIQSLGTKTYPDALVVCPPLQRDPNDSNTFTDAVVIIEVLSPSTSGYDRGPKFMRYQQLPSLRHYLLIDQERVLVEHRKREDDESWRVEVFTEPNDRVRLESIECELSLQELYARVEFNPAPFDPGE